MATRAALGEPAEGELEGARRIVLSILGGQRARVYLFGSRAWGNPAPNADIDIGILPEDALAPGTLSALREAFEESRIPYHVDVVDLSAVDEPFRRKVIRDGVLWNG